MKMKRHLTCGLSRLWHLVSFVSPPNAGRVGVHSNCIKRKGRSNGEEHHAEAEESSLFIACPQGIERSKHYVEENCDAIGEM